MAAPVVPIYHPVLDRVAHVPARSLGAYQTAGWVAVVATPPDLIAGDIADDAPPPWGATPAPTPPQEES